MILSDLKIHHLRNVSLAHLVLNSRFNIIIGPNGSGKTTILEALYLLSCGHSFKTREVSALIAHDKNVLTVFARSITEETISIQKSSSQSTQVKLNNQFCSSASQIAYALPCQIFYSDIFNIIDAGPTIRRSILDWGLFHVKHNYLSLWKEYKRVLKQRNALLKKHAPYSHFIPWDHQLNQLAIQLDNLRKEYFLQWKTKFYQVLNELTDCSCTIEYYKGWDKKNSGIILEQILSEHFISDNQKMYTQYGAHQADIIISSNNLKAKHILSRGQQKIILIALKLAQGLMLEQNCLYLFDDIVAELDELHQQRLISFLLKQKGQYVITNINYWHLAAKIPLQDLSTYLIKNGTVELSSLSLK